jgi:hypothetical protein
MVGRAAIASCLNLIRKLPVRRFLTGLAAGPTITTDSGRSWPRREGRSRGNPLSPSFNGERVRVRGSRLLDAGLTTSSRSRHQATFPEPIEVFEDFRVMRAEDTIAVRFKKTRARFVIGDFGVSAVRRAIKLDNELQLTAHKNLRNSFRSPPAART